MAEREILIREATPDDIDGISGLYAEYMFDSYLLKFGGPFVKNYLRAIINSKNCVTLVAEEGRITGFIMAALSSKKALLELFFNFEILRGWLKQVLAHPALALESLESILYPLYTASKDVNAELLFIAIQPICRRRNLATELIRQALNLMKQAGIRKVKVTTLVKNEAVNPLLKKLGFEIEKTFRLVNKYMYLYTYSLY